MNIYGSVSDIYYAYVINVVVSLYGSSVVVDSNQETWGSEFNPYSGNGQFAIQTWRTKSFEFDKDKDDALY